MVQIFCTVRQDGNIEGTLRGPHRPKNQPDIVSNLRMKAIMRRVFIVKRLVTRRKTALKIKWHFKNI